MSFFESHAFYFLLGIFIGTMLGFFVAALCVASGRASRMEEKILESMNKEQD